MDRYLARRKDKKYSQNIPKHRQACNKEVNKLDIRSQRKRQERLKKEFKWRIKQEKRELKELGKKRKKSQKENKKKDLADCMFGWKLVRLILFETCSVELIYEQKLHARLIMPFRRREHGPSLPSPEQQFRRARIAAIQAQAGGSSGYESEEEN